MIKIALYGLEDNPEQLVGAFLEGADSSHLLEAATESADEITDAQLLQFVEHWRSEARRLRLKLVVEEGVEGLFGEIKANQQIRRKRS